MLTLLEGLLPKEEPPPEPIDPTALANPEAPRAPPAPEKKMSEINIVRLYVFCLSWSIGAFLEQDDRVKLDGFLRDESEFNLPLPSSSGNGAQTIFDFVLKGERWYPWSKEMKEIPLPENYLNELFTFMVPNVDNARTSYLIDIVAKQVIKLF